MNCRDSNGSFSKLWCGGVCGPKRVYFAHSFFLCACFVCVLRVFLPSPSPVGEGVRSQVERDRDKTRRRGWEALSRREADTGSVSSPPRPQPQERGLEPGGGELVYVVRLYAGTSCVCVVYVGHACARLCRCWCCVCCYCYGSLVCCMFVYALMFCGRFVVVAVPV